MVNIEPKYSEKKHARSFNFTIRYIDDVFQLNNSKFADFVGGIHPIEFEKLGLFSTLTYTSILIVRTG
jgi:acyl-ACP thioesterase